MSTHKINDCSSFRDRLKSLRGTRSKAEFARFIGVSAPLYQKYEEGRIPSPDKLSLIAGSLGVTIDWLLGRDDTPLARVESELAKADADGGNDFKDTVLSEIDSCLSQFRAQPKPAVKETIHQQIALSAKKYEVYCDAHYGEAKKRLPEIGRAASKHGEK